MLRESASQLDYVPATTDSYEVIELPSPRHELKAGLGNGAVNRLEHLGERDHEVFALSRDPETYEVTVKSAVQPKDYEAETPEQDRGLLEDSLADLKGKKVVFIGATFEGGGVAMIRPPLLNFLNKSGVEAHWGVLNPEPLHLFDTTKKMHNLQQDVAEPGEEFTEEDRSNHQELGITNFEHFNEQEYFQNADYYVIDDPQPAAMIPLIRQNYPNAKIVYRNHIQTDRDKMAQEGSQQNVIYKYLHEECEVDKVDAYVAHPVEDFVPHGTHDVVYMPPTSDSFEDLNRNLSQAEINAGLDYVDQDLAIQNQARLKLNGDTRDNQEPLERNRPRITLFARFDPAKGMHIGMELHRQTIQKLLAEGCPEDQLPELVIAGNGSVDDPDRKRMLNAMLELRHEEYGDIKKYIKVVGMSHNYSAVNALIRTSTFVINPSVAEGFEHRINEGIRKYIPGIASNRGGLPLQIREGESGYILNFDALKDPYDLHPINGELQRVAANVANNLLHPEQYKALLDSTRIVAEEFNKREIGTVSSVIRWARALQGQGDRTWLLDKIHRQAYEEEALAA